jgi:hypothetical protein
LLRVWQGHAYWDFKTARYAEHGFFVGTVIDPQTGDKFADSEVALSALWCDAASEKRLLSLALMRSVDLLDDQQQRISLCEQAINLSAANQLAWTGLVNECVKPETPAATVQAVADVVEHFGIGKYDDFAFKILTSFISARPPDEQMAMLDRTTKLFPSRTDLQEELVMRKGDILNNTGKPVDALHLYEQVLENSLQYGPLALDAISRVDTMLRAAGQMPALLDHYRIAWTHMVEPPASGYMWTTPWYIMGDRYGHALSDAGNKAKSAEVLKAIRAVDLSHHDQSADK